MTEPTPAETGHVELIGLEKIFPTNKSTFHALRGIDLDIAPGEFVTLLGPSGCGKTTTLRIIAGFETPSAGDVRLDGASVLQVTPDKRPMAMVFQSYALFPHMSVWENVAYGLKLKKLPSAQLKEEVEQALTSMGLTRMRDRAPSQMSGGQQQRVALARAMVMRPKVLLFDEPLSNLDAKLRVQMRSEIRRLQKRLGITGVYVTHDQDEAMSMSDRIVVMNEGQIEQAASPSEVYRHPASVFVADFIGRANFLRAASARPAGSGQAQVTVLGEEFVTAAAPGAAAAEAVLLVRPESIRLKPAEPGAESVEGRRGRVISSVFYGESVEYVVESAQGNITAAESDPDVGAIFPVGAYVEIGFERQRTWLLPADGQGAYQD
ncbi:MAG: ABC transporter ATP-binding protein [Propionibacteriaceae bacterium]|jgi:iron(III) transport system ATP-binding protein|nr:ABC transporter ATP-binding protein [Propionibacteriaceae bacterium]